MNQWPDILAAIGTALGGAKDEGRQQLLACWDATHLGDHAHRCVLAHYLADLEADLGREIEWDETALAEHAHVQDGDLAAVGIPSARGMLPSLHLNLGDGYLRAGDVATATSHLTEGMAACDALGQDGYGNMIRGGLLRLEQRLDECATASPR